MIVAVDVLGLTIILPLLPFYAEHFGANPTVVGLLISAYAACQLVSGPMLGRLSDRLGRRPLLLVSQAGTFLGFLLLANSWALWVVFVSRIIDGMTAGNLSLAQAYIADVTKPEERAKSFALIGIAFGMGFLIGPGISGFLAQFGYGYPIYLAAALSLTSILTTYFMLPSHVPVEDRGISRKLTLLDWGTYIQYFKKPDLGRLLLQFTAFAFSFSLFVSCFPLFAERRFFWDGHPFGVKQVGYVYAYVGFLGIILQGGLIGPLVKWMGEKRLAWIGFLAAAIGFCSLGWTYTIPMLLVVSAIASLGTGALRPSLTSLITQKTDRREQGTVLGLTQSLMSVSSIVAPFLGGYLINEGWLLAWALVAGLVAAAGMLI